MIVDVALPIRVYKTFNYISEEPYLPGSVLEVPFKNQLTYGFVVGKASDTEVYSYQLKKIIRPIQKQPLFDEKMLQFLKWISQYYVHPLGEVIATALPKVCWQPKKNWPLPLLEVLEKTEKKLVLTLEQQKAADQILDKDNDKPFLLHGITGSGKTEVYLQVLEEILLEGKTGIILVPEISLTPQLVGRFTERLGEKIGIWHSHLTPKERFIQWQRMFLGHTQVVIGARSALFAPLKNLGLIIVDEEHETSYKQEDSIRYHARDMAIVRAKMESAKVILGSATPSLESYQNAKNQKYFYLSLPGRINQKALPRPFLVDLKNQDSLFHKDTPWMSKLLFEKIELCLSKKWQVILYLNRLGYAHFIYCEDCGHHWHCPHCDITLTFYQNKRELRCHYCGFSRNVPSVCQNCKGIRIKTIGFGTEQVEKKLKEFFPKAKIERMDRGVIHTKQDLENLLQRVHNEEIDILIGTQMIAKGHDFPKVALVGILLSDASLNMPDFRSNERTFQIITQVSGRAGRADIAGEVVIQGYKMDHPTILLASKNQFEEFQKQENEARKHFQFPPHKRMALLRFQHSNQQKVRTLSQQLIFFLQKNTKDSILGPSESPLSKVKGMYRFQALIKSDSPQKLHEILKMALGYWDAQKTSVRMAIDVDPITLW